MHDGTALAPTSGAMAKMLVDFEPYPPIRPHRGAGVPNDLCKALETAARRRRKDCQEVMVATRGWGLGTDAIMDRNSGWVAAVEIRPAGESIASCHDDEVITVGRPCQGLDQTPGRAEREGVLMVLRAARKVGALVHLIVDNLNVCRGLWHAAEHLNHHQRYASGDWDDIVECLSDLGTRGLMPYASWIPSHDKKSSWTPPENHSAETCRDLNSRADVAAGDAAEGIDDARLSKVRRALLKRTKAWQLDALAVKGAAQEKYWMQIKKIVADATAKRSEEQNYA